MEGMKTIIAAALALAVATASGESVISDTRDEFTDERQLLVAVTAELNDDTLPKLGGSGLLSFKCLKPGRSMVAIQPAGFVFHLSDGIKVRLRFEDAKARTETWRWSSKGKMALLLREGRRVRSLLAEAIQADRLIVKVGDTDTLRFNLADARTDLQEFLQRCDSWAAEH